MIRIENLTKNYGAVPALRGINIHVQAGELFGFLGPNGAGKTTTLQILAGLVRPSSGSVTVAGIDVLAEPRLVKRRLGYVPDRPYLYEKLTGREFLDLIAELYGLSRRDARRDAAHWLEVFGMTTHSDDLVEGYSHGMKQRIVLAGTLLHDPEVLIVDEPMVGLDPQGARLLKDLMRQRCRAGKTVLMSTHTLEVAEQTCHRVGIINRGEIVADGTLDELRQQYQDDGASLEELFLRMTRAADETGEGVSTLASGRRT